MADSPGAFFLPVESGRRFCVYHAPADGIPGPGLVYVHPFAEEMNKSRRMAALQAHRFAAGGCGVLIIDLYGCGDSEGDFGDARWSIWKRDVQAAVSWLRQRVGGPLGLWGLRLGAMLAADVAREPDADVDRLVLWQPVVSGEAFLTQFLRLQLASEMLTGGAAQSGVRELRRALELGKALEVAGYELHPELAAALDGLRLSDLAPAAATVHWHEVTVQLEPRLMPASQRVVDAWKTKGLDVRTSVVGGEPFWATPEIAESALLLDATAAGLKELMGS